MMFGVFSESLEAIWKKIGFQPILAKKHGLTPWDFGQNFKFAKTFCIGKRRREMMFGVFSESLEAIWKKIGFQPILAKKHGLTPWDFGQNFKFAKTFCIGKRRREMMFGVFSESLEAIWKKIGFQPILAKKHGLTPWDFGQNFKFAKTFCIGKRRREMMFGVFSESLEAIWKKIGFQPILAKKHGLTPWDFGQNFKFAKTFCIGKRFLAEK